MTINLTHATTATLTYATSAHGSLAPITDEAIAAILVAAAVQSYGPYAGTRYAAKQGVQAHPRLVSLARCLARQDKAFKAIGTNLH